MSPKPWENAEGYADPTAYNAIKKVSAEEHEALDAKVNTLIKVLKFIIAESGFELAARIELRDRKTGRFLDDQMRNGNLPACGECLWQDQPVHGLHGGDGRAHQGALQNLRGQDNAAHIAEEIADVEIMLEQLKLMFSIRDEVTQQRTVKLQRLDNRISQSLIHPKP